MMSPIQGIKNHLELRNKLQAAVKDVLHKKKNVQEAAISYKLSQETLNRKIYIEKRKVRYFKLKSKFELAVKEYLDGGSTIKAAAIYYGISQKSLRAEIRFFERYISTNKLYEYNKCIERKAIFTFKEEVLLMWDLNVWKMAFQPYCFCQQCAMEQLLILANQYVNKRKVLHLEGWNKTKPPGIRWLINFEMKFSSFISNAFLPNCINEPTTTQALTNKLKSSSLLLVSKLKHDIQRKNFDQSRIHNARDMSTQTEITFDYAENDEPMNLSISF